MKFLQILGIFGIPFILILNGCAAIDRCSSTNTSQPPAKILFIGNSYVFTNDLPYVFRQLACSGNHPVEVEMSAFGGWTLQDHVSSPKTLEIIQKKKWDFVILQEQSEIPAFENSRNSQMFPAARSLVSEIRKNGAMPLFFLTWGHREGMPEDGIPNYLDMQNNLTEGYQQISRELGVKVIPVGYAWQLADIDSNSVDLWQSDGSHPSKNGTYLAANVIYASIFQASPVGLEFSANLSRKNAISMQTYASRAVQKGGW